MIAKTPQCLGPSRIVGRDHAAFAGCQVFHGMEAEHSHVGNASDLLALILRAQRVARVFDQHSPARGRNRLQFFQRRRMTGIVDCDDGLCAGGQLLRNGPRIQIRACRRRRRQTPE